MDAERPVEELVAKGMDYLKKLLAQPKEDLAADFYFAVKLVSNRRSVALQQVQEILKDVYEEAAAAMQSGDFERSAVRLSYIFYETFYYNDLPENIRALLARAVEAAGGKSVEEASGLLYDAMDDIMEGNLDVPDFSALGVGNAAAQQMMQQATAAAAAMQQKMMKQMADGGIAELQQKMMEAMARGDMQEYMRLAGELQQKMMSNLFN